jgi:hypothetical protein
MKITFKFTGRYKNALGVYQSFIETTSGLNVKECFLSLYNKYEHIHSPVVIYNGLEFRFNRDDYTLSFTSQWSHLGYEKVTTDAGVSCFFMLNADGVVMYVPSVKIAQLEMIRMAGFNA